MNTQIPNYLSDEQAEIIGQTIARELGLKRSETYIDGWQTDGGTFTNKGLARRIHRFIQDGIVAAAK